MAKLLLIKWRRGRDSNPWSLAGSLVFKTSSLNHSDTSPNRIASCDFISISQSVSFVNNFFIIFKKIKRRRRDLNPRAGFPTYTLSRGTSSATWVLLLARIVLVFHKTKFDFYLFCAVTQNTLYAHIISLSTINFLFYKNFYCILHVVI